MNIDLTIQHATWTSYSVVLLITIQLYEQPCGSLQIHLGGLWCGNIVFQECMFFLPNNLHSTCTLYIWWGVSFSMLPCPLLATQKGIFLSDYFYLTSDYKMSQFPKMPVNIGFKYYIISWFHKGLSIIEMPCNMFIHFFKLNKVYFSVGLERFLIYFDRSLFMIYFPERLWEHCALSC